MDVTEAVEPAADQETIRIVAEILEPLKGMPLGKAKGILRQALIAAEALSVVSPSS
jgi:hypothetical protein